MMLLPKYFRFACGFGSLVFALLAICPLATLAFEGRNVSSSSGEETKTAAAVVNLPIEYPYSLLMDETNTVLQPGKPVYDKYTVAERKVRNLPTALPVVTPYYAEKIVYLTFDDGPDPENTPKVLDILRQYGIKATFFVVGSQVEQYPHILKRTFEEGHAIGNHSYNHIYSQLYQSAHTYIRQLHQTDDVIKNVIGVRPRISRAPGGSAGSFTKEYWKALEQDGYVEIGWNISSGDASSAKAPQIVDNIIRQMRNKFLWNHAIVLMHDGRGHSETVKALPHIITYFQEQGFEFRVINLETPPAW
ncbi:polysaccharide deacetylase [Thermosinus carboxydivorans Nor1]|uniref:Polysaccharide deacetylase n=1 Tax=Thermosinus carboxydivorans Nor1 TaxID=401526 RepID=A1HTR9_9FIRM|nr:polysaccharide deacetylase family protein [Thermosinus carboxydivorans]EAX46554.1 polysaccharide deacetylase [Thermosinus carboxydivorans Nor1]